MSTIVSGSQIKNENDYRVDPVHLIDTQNAIDSTEMDFLLPAGYDRFQLVATDILPGNDNVALYAKTSSDGGVTFDATNYYVAGQYALSVSTDLTSTGYGKNNTTEIQLNAIKGGLGIGRSTGEGVHSMTIDIFNPSAVKSTSMHITTSYVYQYAQHVSWTAVATRRVDEAVDALRIYPSAGDLERGRFKLYGWVS